MKKVACLWAAMIAILLFTACGTQQPEAPQQEAAQIKTTLMIYMVGSDLEPQAGAASADLQEIAESGIDLSCNQVVVCAGGAPYWHNEQVSAEQINILALQEEGFGQVSTMDSASMGTAQQLHAFLNFCWENYPNDEFALILWDHGNGPVMGYGKDILYGNDALLLAEMAQALEASAFSSENKLSWIGFDACLMASAELSCTLAEYADYLVASQEIEPSFGWNYSFLSQLGKASTPQLLTNLVQAYMTTCDEYYTKRNYENYDVTLSVVDLSCAAELDAAINELFSAAASEVEHYYDLLAMNRAQSRALGRATTGSEYDLVDLKDMAAQLSTQYPQQTKNLLDVIDRMVVLNGTSIEGSCGLSLYYPFYNKYYYETNWNAVYTELGIFPEYQAYLADYAQTWLKEDKLDSVAQELVPEQTAEDVYSITLSQEQARSFGMAQFHILERVDGDIYRKVFSSRDVTWENNTLSANYDGMAIYVQLGSGARMLAPTTAVDQIDRLFRYSGRFQLHNGVYKPADLSDEELPEEGYSHWRYLLTLNSETGKVEMSGVVPYEDSSDQLLVESGRVAEPDQSQYGSITFFYSQSRYLTRYENGTIKPLDQWYKTDMMSGYQEQLANGYSFEYAPLAGGEYFLTFEVTDTQSGRYCTELLPITVEDVPEQKQELTVTRSKWEKGEARVLLEERDGIRLYLTTQDTEYNGTRYFLEAENFNDYPVRIMASDAVINETLQATGNIYMTVRSQDFMYEELYFGVAEAMGVLQELNTLQLEIQMEHDRSGEYLWPAHLVQVDMTHAPAVDTASGYRDYLKYDAPCMGALAEKQVIYETEEVRLTLMGVGQPSEETGGGKPEFCFYMENLSEKDLYVGIEGVVINGCFVRGVDEQLLPAGMQTCLNMSLYSDDLENLGFDQIHSLSFLAAVSEKTLRWMNDAQCIWCPVTLQQAGQKQLPPTGTLLWEEQGVRISVKSHDRKENRWQVIIENHTDQDISLDLVDALYDGKPYEGTWRVMLFDSQLGAGQTTIGEIWLSDWSDTEELALPQEVAFRIQVRNFYETEVLFTSEETVILPQ